MPFRDGFDPWRLAGEGFHVRKVPFVYSMFPVALRSGYSHASGNEELVEQEDNISILPRVAADPSAPVDRTELSASDIPLAALCVAVWLIEPWIALRPSGNILVLEERLFADYKESWPRKFGRSGRWSFCLMTGTLCPSNQERS